jgi:LruC domain-containing protein
MKNTKPFLKTILSLIIIIGAFELSASTCTITKTNGMGFTTTIESVVNNCNGTYTIKLLFAHNGCGGPSCKALSHLSIQASPGTYSNISATKLSGNWAYGSLSMGPNLGSDPFQGFKFDNTSGIGGGNAGNVRITYTISGALQQQQVSAKAGTSGNIVTFSIADFTYVMNCAGTGCNPTPSGPADFDNDGCVDSLDAYPSDPARCFDNYKTGTLAFEDLWPAKGDFDFNDLVIEYNFKSVTNSNNKVIDIVAKFTVRAFGAGYHNGFGFQLPNNINQTHLSATGMNIARNYITLGSNGLENAQSKPTFIVYDDTYDFMPYPGSGIGVNTSPGATYVQPDTITLNISVQPDTYTIADLGLNNFNPFIIVNQTRSHEVHLPYYAPTSLANMNLFGTLDDASVPANGKYYVTATNIPWAIHIPEAYVWPKEKVDIMQAHTKFDDWAEGNGSVYADWYKNLGGYRNTENLY